jgi:lysozyme
MGDLISGEATILLAAEIVKAFEGYRAKPYKCTGNVWTIGFGRTGTDVTESTPTSTIAKETEWLLNRLERDLVTLRNKLRPLLLNPNQEAALLSFCYNVGFGNFNTSGVFRILRQSENSTLDIGKLTTYWKSWNKSSGKVTPGLVRRRQAEIELFMREIN